MKITRLNLTNYRNYGFATLAIDSQIVVLSGHNGAGKTNILEAISLLSPGRGLRGARFSDIDCKENSGNESDCWTVFADVENDGINTAIGTSRINNTESEKRSVMIDGKHAPISNLADVMSVSWLTPQMAGLFIDGATERRRYMDRLVYNFDPAHARRVNAYESAMRERNRLLKENCRERAWYAALERQLAAHGIAIAAARFQAMERINNAIQASNGSFPKALLIAEGEPEKLLEGNSALKAEDQYQAKLEHNRALDLQIGRTAFGIHRSDLTVIHSEKNSPAQLCSTGEQKALLLSITLAVARAQKFVGKSPPIMLLDEVIAHLDEPRRHELFAEILELGAQTWLTGTDAEVFANLADHALFFKVNAGKLLASNCGEMS
jgi:DNA replication and repair protein RecF